MQKSDEDAFVNGIADRNLRISYGFPVDMDTSVLSTIFQRFCKLTGAYSIVEKKTNSMIGFLLDVDPELPEEISESLPEKGRTLAFATFPPYQRQGYMKEALKVYTSYQFQNNETEYIHCGHFMDNDPSRCLLQKLGFIEYSRHAFKGRTIIDQILRGKTDMNQSIERLTDRIVHILDNHVHSIWLYGSVVLDDFRLGWSDIDLLVLSNSQITEQQAQQLIGLRQIMLEAEPDNPYYRSFEGMIADRDEYLAGSFSRLVYWGTSGQRITDHCQQDVFSAYELAKYGQSVYGENDRSIFLQPSWAELRDAVKQHYESIRKYAVQTDDKLYSCGWLLDIARCIYTLRFNDVIAKTQAGLWALSEHIFQDEEPLKKALEIRQNPAAYEDKGNIKQWLKSLGSVVQQYADVLEQELKKNGGYDDYFDNRCVTHRENPSCTANARKISLPVSFYRSSENGPDP